MLECKKKLCLSYLFIATICSLIIFMILGSNRIQSYGTQPKLIIEKNGDFQLRALAMNTYKQNLYSSTPDSEISTEARKWVLVDMKHHFNNSSGAEVIKLFSCSAQLSLKFILLINVKMPTIVGILTFMSRINYWFLSFETEFSTNFGYFNIYEQLKFHAQLS